MNCNITDKERENGKRCRSFECTGCREFARKNISQKQQETIDQLESALKKAEVAINFTKNIADMTVASNDQLQMSNREAMYRFSSISRLLSEALEQIKERS